MSESVSVTIVTCNSRRYIASCLESVFRQEDAAPEVVIVDNGSSDGTEEILSGYRRRVRILYNSRNAGFATAQNQAIAASRSDWVLTLNPDVVLEPNFLRRLLEAAPLSSDTGALCGRLLKIGADLTPLPEPRIDSTGIYFTPAMRHFDRGSLEPDDGQYHRMEYVFGATAAAALYRRAMIDDISPHGEFFDPDFFVYREDADVAWRAQLLGWRCLYVPSARGYHVRRVLPANRRSLPAEINMHSVKNRFLMRIKNATPGLYRHYWLPMTMRDIVVAGACLFWEPKSLPAFWHVARSLGRALERRRWIMARRRAPESAIVRWFSAEMCAQPLAVKNLTEQKAILWTDPRFADNVDLTG